MYKTTIHCITRIQDFTLAVFYTEEGCWQYRVISPGGVVFGECKLYYTADAAERHGREWIGQ